MEETNESLQADEIQALSAIYENDWVIEDATQRVYSINITNSAKNSVQLQVILPESYPLNSPPIYQISAPWMSRASKENLCSDLEDIYCQNIGVSIIYMWVEKIRDFIENNLNNNAEGQVKTVDLPETLFLESETLQNVNKINDLTVDELPTIHHGEPIIDRKSVFQAHVAKVISVEQVKQVLQKLKENRKIAIATHNIYAYRISQGDTKAFIQDCEDDGETKAGSGLLHLLQILEVEDVLVIVSRWYGGIHLGPDRFKHINNVARNLLSSLGYITEKQTAPSKKSKKR